MTKLLVFAIFVGIFGILYWKFLDHNLNELDARNFVRGNVKSGFEEVQEEFGKILKNEREGLALAVYVKDQLVVDLWGGYADWSSNRSWTSNTMACTYSTTKVFGSLTVGRLVAQGLLKYEDKVTKYWPEYEQNGKENTTVDDLINHKSKPLFEPGSAPGYHAYTFGLLLDQLVRRVDPKKRIVADIYNEEILPKLGGKKDKIVYLNKVRKLSYWTTIGKISSSCSCIGFSILGSNLHVSFKAVLLCLHLPVWAMVEGSSANTIFDCTQGILKEFSHQFLKPPLNYNNPDVLAYPTTSSTGVGTARGLAKAGLYFFQKTAEAETLKKNLCKPLEFAKDIVIGMEFHRAHGICYLPHPVLKDKFVLFGMGHGGQFLIIDIENEISFAILRNGLLNLFSDDVFDVFNRIAEKIFRISLQNKL